MIDGFGYLGTHQQDAQTHAIMSNVKLLIFLAFYVAWRVTPESKNQ